MKERCSRIAAAPRASLGVSVVEGALTKGVVPYRLVELRGVRPAFRTKTLHGVRTLGFRIALAVSVLAPCAIATPSFAQSAKPAGGKEKPLGDVLKGPAKDSYQSAKLLFRNGDFAGAAAKFHQAYDVSKDPRLLFDVAICDKNLRAYASMQDLLERYQKESVGLSPQQLEAVQDALAAIKNLVGAVVLTVNIDGADVTADGQSVGTTALAAPLKFDLGKHHIEIRKEGFDTVVKDVQIAGGTSESVLISMVKEIRTGRLLVTAESGATIEVDGHVVGTDRFDGRLDAGSHEVRVTGSDKVPYEAEVELHPRETRTVEVALLSQVHSGGAAWPWVVGGVVVAAGAAVGGYFLFKPSDDTRSVPTASLANLHLSQ